MAILLLFLQKFELKWRKLKLKNKLKKIIPSALFRLVVYVNGRAYFSDSTYGLSARPEYISRMFLDVAGKTTCRGGTTCHRLQPRRQLTFHRFRTTFFSEPQRHFTAEPNAPPGFQVFPVGGYVPHPCCSATSTSTSTVTVFCMPHVSGAYTFTRAAHNEHYLYLSCGADTNRK